MCVGSPRLRRMETTRLDVLVVDDEPALREVLSLRIADWGHDVRAVGDTAERERELDRRRPDIVLCDVVLPGESGLELLKRIKRHDERLPVVMMTAHGNIDAAVEAMKAGATDFLTKPLDYAMLYALLEATASDVRQRRGSQSLDAISSSDRRRLPGLVGQSRSMRELQRTIEVAGVERRVGDHHREERHGQGSRRARGSRAELAARQAVHRDQRGGDSRRA